MMMLKFAGAAAITFTLAAAAQAQNYPAKDVHLVVGFAAGSGPDITARFLSERLRAKFDRPVIVDNKPGAFGNIATEYVAKAKPNGLTFLLTGGGSLVATAYLFKKPPVDVTKFETVATIARAPLLMVVANNSPHQKLADLSAAVKAKGDKASYGTAFPAARVLGAIYKQQIGANAVEIQYKTSADWVNDLNSGNIDFGFVDAASGVGMAKGGRFRIIAVTSDQRAAALPDLPTLTENGIKTDLSSWWALFAPQGTPAPILDKVHDAVSAIAKTDEAHTFFAATGNDIWVTPRSEAQAFYLKDYKNWEDYVKVAKIEPQG